ncbi:3-isopropylmalate dehydratase large subunit [Spirochaeta isovalerica]|uniref:3-isopropylmalate dehydratase large subunit n=1 Tax=Spirochaeta isovalerica TaxID=150 RepID=A0A841R804_9SPIO|nr:3-isopropylmalate dehydratase large subunit [Spirochaeta isovalerica]MBB6480005.1 3-isopropylmalate/(R)-2-methylmalate dehydratase large subunit [Spirochaeta isovalerica]
MSQNLLNKVWDIHKIKTLPTGQDQLFISLHLIHEVTSPQAFGMLGERGLKVLYPERTFGTVDHIIPTDKRERPFDDELAEGMIRALEDNTAKNGISYFGPDSDHQGIVHIMGPELGLTQPGLTIACGDSHTSTHGAFGAIAFGIGTSQIRDILATQTMALSKPKVRRINISGTLKKGVYAKDIILKIIADLGVNGGLGFAYEYGGEVIDNMSMEERMTICNMTIEGGARVGYVNPDNKTYEYLKGRKYAPEDYETAVERWKSLASGKDAEYDDVYNLDVSSLEPMVTWGINPGQALGVGDQIPEDADEQACSFMGFDRGQVLKGTEIDVAFIGSCTNGRISDLRIAAEVVKGKKVRSGVRALVVPGSRSVADQAEREGLHTIFKEAGFQWREPGCSMCLAMNPDKLEKRELCASSSNRNFIGRQGSPTGRTVLMSPAMVAAAAVNGVISDVREML